MADSPTTIELRPEMLKDLEELRVELKLKSNTEVLDLAMNLLQWAAETTRSGMRLAGVALETRGIEYLDMPHLSPSAKIKKLRIKPTLHIVKNDE